MYGKGLFCGRCGLCWPGKALKVWQNCHRSLCVRKLSLIRNVGMTAKTEHGYGFHSFDVLLKVALLPLHTSQPLDAVKQQLNNMLFKYSESLEGVPLSYSDISFPKGKEFARIMADQFWLHVDICTKLVIFKPVLGQRIRGKVNKVQSVKLSNRARALLTCTRHCLVVQVSGNNVSILILALFNASLDESVLKKQYIYSAHSKSW
jgi:hypothetical protein